jgi:hypothetical protein
MRSANDTRLLIWLRVREFAVPPAMIETATARRLAGDWAGACAAARVDVDLHPRAVARTHGDRIASQIRADLRALAPDLLRWHLPRVAPDGLLRPGLTVALARYDPPAAPPLYLVARTPPAWADAGQRISLALWTRSADRSCAHPRPRPDRRFRLDLHRHLWDARRAGELWQRTRPDLLPAPGWTSGYAVHRWAAEARLLLRGDGISGGPVIVRLDRGRRLLLDPDGPEPRPTGPGSAAGRPVLPDAATRIPPDLELLRAGLIEADRLHPLVATALTPDGPRARPSRVPPAPRHSAGAVERIVDCGGARHRIGLAGGVLTPLDHDPAELRREAILVALGGSPLPCLRAVDETIRHPESLADVRARLDHGDFAGALRLVEGLLGPDALLRDGALRDELETAALRRLTHGMFRAGFTGFGPPRHEQEVRRRRDVRSRPRQAINR